MGPPGGGEGEDALDGPPGLPPTGVWERSCSRVGTWRILNLLGRGRLPYEICNVYIYLSAYLIFENEVNGSYETTSGARGAGVIVVGKNEICFYRKSDVPGGDSSRRSQNLNPSTTEPILPSGGLSTETIYIFFRFDFSRNIVSAYHGETKYFPN
jgi:hypothetical protein